jgi:hypothetical protein
MIVYPGEMNQPCQAEYGISITRGLLGTRSDIVVVDSAEGGRHHTPLIDADIGRDIVLNKILSTDLQGVRLDQVRFFIVVNAESPFEMSGYEFPIQLDMEDYRRQGNSAQIEDVIPTSIKGWLRYALGFYVKRESVMKRDVVGGCAIVKTDQRRRHVTAAEARLILTAVGYPARWRYPGLRLVFSRLLDNLRPRWSLRD